MNVLITGGAGFIGSHISKLLLDRGHSVAVYDNLSHSTKNSVDPRAKFIKGDLNHRKLLVNSLKVVDAVIHMAALIEVPESIKKPMVYLENNVMGTINLLESMLEAGVRKIIFSSSACVYGTPKRLPITERHTISAANPYGATKVACEALLSSYNQNHGFDVVILRYFNPYGPVEYHENESHVIPNFIRAALNKKPIPLYWKGLQTRDFIYVEDLADAHIAPLDLKGFHVFNVGTERGVRVIDVVNVLSDILGYRIKINHLGERLGDIPASFASSKKLQKATGWKAKVDLEEGLRKTVEWFKENQ